MTFENGQARERTQVLMDIANQNGGMVIGTGDLSELALGWCTYNGDHMTKYAVNACHPQDSGAPPGVLHLRRQGQRGPTSCPPYWRTFWTPQCPRSCSPPFRARSANGPRIWWGPTSCTTSSRATILKWLNTFYRRFFTQQFSRYNVVGVGDEMAEVFTAAGISVLHDRTLYDYSSYNDAYNNALAAIETYLAEYPSIRFILDVHRDAIGDAEGNQYKVISEIDGVGTSAQMTLVMGSDGSGLAHEHWMENLKLAVALQDNILQSYPTLMRPILLRNSRYNQHATTGSLLVEVGAAGNSPEEAALAGRLFAQQMADYLIDLGK